MQENDNIFNLLREEEAEASRRALRGVILQPGAIGDCILTLPLVEFMKDRLGLGGVDILGHAEYTGILPGRTCVDSIRSIDSVDLHRLFVEPNTFDLADGDALINVFSDYAWIVTFLGEPDSNFEQNLIFTANCSRSVEVITLSLKPSEKSSTHITDFYIEQFAAQSGLSPEPPPVCKTKSLIKATKADINRGKELLKEINVDSTEKLIVIQPGSGGSHKCWHLDNFINVAKELASKGTDVIFLLGPAEMERLNTSTISRIESISKILTNLPLADVLAVLSNASGYTGNDSGITHLSATLGIRTVAVFGPTDPAVYGPIGPTVTVLQGVEPDFTKKPSAKLQQKLLKALMT
ncbi:MAG: glycosyltransferase family 9 protein [Phycisphaerae bacterium]|nr:glycosyltransferase family 9 protein [Phycisphaerae bacterium]MDD5381212.1 glycosyltransferase family 9 protein [Phycisphaerae bacterium]